MANEVTVTASLQYADSDDADQSISVSELLRTVTTKKFIRAKQTIGITEEALILGEVTSPFELFIINRDTTNFVNVKCATSGTIFAKLLAGKAMLVPLGSGAQAPFIIADTAPVLIEYLVISL